jgi:predicted esterase
LALTSFARSRSAGFLTVALLLAACALAAGLLHLWQRHTDEASAQAGRSAADAADDPPVDWCAAGFEPIAGGGCLAVSPVPRRPAPLVVYLHGRYARAAPGDERDRASRLAARATSRGFAVLALRGRLGECTDPDLADWYCWPSNERNADRAAAVVDARARAVAEATQRSGARRTFLLGFSSGGYFAGLLASRGLLDVAAVAVAHGGPVEPVRARDRMPPLLLLSADDDVAQDDMIRYEHELARERWPHDSYARSGGHALTDEDIDAALTFFLRAGERLPLVPPLPLHRAVPHSRDAEVRDERTPDALELGSAAPPDESPVDRDASAEVADD